MQSTTSSLPYIPLFITYYNMYIVLLKYVL